MAPSPYFSIVSVNYRSVWALSVFLGSLFATEKELFEVIVVNNDPRETRALQHLATLFPIRIIETGENSGFGQGANDGVSLAQGKVIGFLNPDTEWQNPFLARMRDFFEKQSTPAVVGVPLFTKSGTRELWSSGSAPKLSQLMWNALPLGQSLQPPTTLDWVSGGSLFLPKELFSSLSGFDKDFFLYFEDVDLCVRAKQGGAMVLGAPFGAVTHSGGRSFSSRAEQKRRYYASQVAYFQKHRPKREYLFVRLFHQVFHSV